MSTPFVVTGWWAAAFTVAILAMLALAVHGIVTAKQGPITVSTTVAEKRRRGIKSLIVGEDGRASTSKTQVVLWTVAVLGAYIFMMLWGRSIDCDGSKGADAPECVEAARGRVAFDEAIAQPLQSEYYVLLGLPAAAAVAAMALTKTKIATGTLTKTEVADDSEVGVGNGIADLVSNDHGQVDLIDLQYFAFNLLTLGWFALEFAGKPSLGLPQLPPTLLGLSGVAVATYTTKKALAADARPVIAQVVPTLAPAAITTKLRLFGNGFGEGTPAVQLNDRSLTVVPLSDSEASATLTADAIAGLPAAAAGADTVTAQVTLVTADGTASDPVQISFYEPRP